MNPLVSIVTPSYNQGRFLEDTIRSVLAQDYASIEYIVIDGASTDNSLDILQRYHERLAYWESQPDRGQAHAINKGLRRASGAILGWLNADDLLVPGAVSRAVDLLTRNPAVDVVYGRLERIDDQGRPVPTPLLPKDRLTFGKELAVGECIVNQPGSFWRRQAMETAGLLDENLQYALDYEYWIRLALNGAIFARLPDAVACFRLSPESKTVSHTAAMAVEQMAVLDRLLATPDLPARLGLSAGQIQRQADRARARIALHAAYGNWKLGRSRAAIGWLAFALRRDPLSPLDRRWRDLALAGLRRKRQPARSQSRKAAKK